MWFSNMFRICTKNRCHQTNSPFCHDWMISGLWLHLFRSKATFERLDYTSRAEAPYWPYVETPKETKTFKKGKFPKTDAKATCKCNTYVEPSCKFCCRTTDPTAQHGLHCHPNSNSSGTRCSWSLPRMVTSKNLRRSTIRSGSIRKTLKKLHALVCMVWLVNGRSHMSKKSSVRDGASTSQPGGKLLLIARPAWLLTFASGWSTLVTAWQGLIGLQMIAMCP